MTKRALMLLIVLPALAGAVLVLSAQEKSHKLQTVSLRKMADSLHAVIAADQYTYVKQAESRTTLDHAQLLKQAAQHIQTAGAEFSYTLRSLWPINKNQGPQTQVEQTGLEFVAAHPQDNYYTEEELGGRSYFTAVYPERATLTSCVECHNQHPRSPRRDFKLDDVMGAIVVRLPLEF